MRHFIDDSRYYDDDYLSEEWDEQYWTEMEKEDRREERALLKALKKQRTNI